MNPKSLILIITAHSPESYSPAGERIHHMALAGVSSFQNVIVLALRTSNRTNKQEAPRASSKAFLCTVNFKRLLPFPLSDLFDPMKFLMLLIHGFRISRDEKPSCILASMPPLEPGVSAWFISRLLRIRLIIDLRDDWESALSSQLMDYVPKALLKPLFKFATKVYSSASSILVITRILASTIRQRQINTPIVLAPNGANTSLFFPRSEEARRRIRMKYRLPRDKLIMIYCGSGLNPYYRLDLVFFSLKLLPNDVKEKIFSVFYLHDGIEHVRRLKSRLKMSDSLIEVRDPLPRRIVAEVMAGCDIGLVPFDDKPYLRYATSSKIHEYMSAGLYVIGSGPKRGELAAFLSENPMHGVFIRPTVENFLRVFSKVAGKAESLINNDSRNTRHAFTKENYNRQKIMKGVMKTLCAKLTKETIRNVTS